MSNLIQDIRYALRLFRKNPGFTAVAALSLALGIGANSAIFTLVGAVLLKWLSVKSPEQLYVVATNPGRLNTSWNYPDYAASRDRGQGFQGLIAYNSPSPMGFSVKGETGERTELGYGLMVSGNYFQVLGVDPALGRVLNPEDDRAPGASPYAVLSYDFWRRRFGGDPRVIGRGVNINNSPFTIVGVARAGFTGVEVGSSPDFFVPTMMRTQVTGNANWNNRHHWWMTVMGRAKPGIARKQIEAELYVIQQQQEQEERRTAADQRFVQRAQPITLLEGSRGYSSMRNRLSQPLIVLMTIVGLVLLIACANVANLLLARAAGRQREIAVRLAVGAGRKRLVSQLLVESVLLSLIGGAAGLLLSFAGVRVLLGFVQQGNL